jgi:carboxypeptidase C (cathepsin A)
MNILINVGDFDMKDGVRQTMEWTKNIEWKQKAEFFSQSRSQYIYNEGSDQKVGGWFRSAGNFTLIVTPKAGHMVPFA